MDFETVKPLQNAYLRKLNATNCKFRRYLHKKINWDARLIGIKGARGVGKTTLMLQHIKDSFKDASKAFYVSLDDLWFNKYPLEELVECLYNQGVEAIFLDEIHKLKDWQRYLKNFYDSYPDLKIVYTGSAMLAIDHSKADLSRRQALYDFNGLSLREYVEYECGVELPVLTLAQIVENHINIAMDLPLNIKILKAFDDYMRRGYYPFYKETGEDYYMRLSDVVKTVIDIDIPAVEDIEFATLEKLKRLLMVIAGTCPFEPNISKLSEQLGNSREHTLKMLSFLHRAGLLNCLYSPAKSYKRLSGPDKVYVNNTNLMYALSQNIEQGTAREAFFANQTGVAHSVVIPENGDFLLDDKYLFEVGGRRKSYRQIADIPNSFLAVADTECGFGNRIPLWMFGMMY
ncbi:MAG: ATP-binding protein [Bacteroidales bacterium]|nr:ATP-binding protein [Bacteroidales bacterium]